MTNNRQQFISPETRPEYARVPTLSLAIGKILDVLDKTYNIEQSLADQAAVEAALNRPFVLRAIDYTTKTYASETIEPSITAVTFPSSIQHNLITEAEVLVDSAYDEAA